MATGVLNRGPTREGQALNERRLIDRVADLGGGFFDPNELAALGEQGAELAQFSTLGGSLEGFSTNDPNLRRDARNRTERVSEILKQLSQGADPESLGLRSTEELSQARRDLAGRRNQFFNRPENEFQNLVGRIRQGLASQIGARGFGVEQTQGIGANPLEELTALRGGQFGDQQLTTPVQGAISQFTDLLETSQNLGGFFNVFNPPPFAQFL